jgi:UPF0755 protein
LLVKIDRKKALPLVGAVAVTLLGLSLLITQRGGSSAPDFPCAKVSSGATASNLVTIDVSAGETGSEIAQELFDKGVTASFQSFFGVAVSDKRSGSIAPGIHQIDKKICAKEALEQLLDAKRITNLLSVIEGAWNSEIKKSLVSIGYSQSEVSKAFTSYAIPKGFSTLEGLLFPAQYSFDTSTAVSTIIEEMVLRSQREMKSAGIFTSQEKYSPAQLLTIASLVQAEGDQQDFAKISQVVRNRLVKGMPLQFDSTVHYVKESRGSVFLSTQSTLLNSPYNTYRRYGLPPGPINNPGSKAMYAATHPEKGAWLFFITVAPGDTRFTESIEEFNGWKVLYKKNLRAGKFGSK